MLLMSKQELLIDFNNINNSNFDMFLKIQKFLLKKIYTVSHCHDPPASASQVAGLTGIIALPNFQGGPEIKPGPLTWPQPAK